MSDDKKGKKPSAISIMAKTLLNPPPPPGGYGSKKRPAESSGNSEAAKKVDDKSTPEKVETNDLTLLESDKEDEKEDEVELGPLSAETEQEIANSQEILYPNYAGALKKKKIDQDLLLYVQRGREKRLPLPKKIWEMFSDALMQHLVSMDPDDVTKINIDWNDHHLGRGIICCLDSKTTAWVKAFADSFNYEGETLRAWSRMEFGKRTIFAGFLHSKSWCNKNGPSAMNWIFKINKLEGNYNILAYSHKTKGVYVRFETDDEGLIKGIEAKNLSLCAGICRLVLKRKDLQQLPIIYEKSGVLAEGMDTSENSNQTA